MGTSTWATTENSPVSAVPNNSHGRLGAQALITSPAVAISTMRVAEDVAAACGQVRGRLSIGEISSLTALDLVDLLAVFHERYPDVDVRWLTAKSELLLALAELADEVLVDFPEGTGARRQTDEAFQAAGLRHRVQFEIGHIRLVEKFVQRSMAVGLVPERIARGFTQVAMVPLVDAPVRHLYAVWSPSPTPAARAFLDVLEEKLLAADG
ncbi:hypothetical protein WR25_25009 [Diploscapter pachys]|uniref:LysR substrate-binding domain-containing protein n=1 Tax=Diploscapter pachys TaxID=2018661 RepID=A0A2A2KA47_9BILA|nr:hypothetical protein WR25_25009 [Diploscapter pachys]